LREELLSLTLRFGKTYPVERETVERSRNLGPSDFTACYPGLDTLCHYTNASGLEGILKTGTLWATNVAYLNDPEEFRFAYRTFERMVSRGEHALDPTLVRSFLEGLRTWGHDHELIQTFVISFSARRDDLSQFRAYSDNGRGYIIEFEPCDLVEALNSHLRHGSGEYFTLRCVRYGEEGLSQFHVQAIEKLKGSIGRLPHPVGSSEHLSAVRAFGMDFHNYLREAGVVFKQGGYVDEEEYRAVLDVAGLMDLPLDVEEKMAVRFRGAMPVPYIPFQFLPLPERKGYFIERENKGVIKRVVVGPSVDFDLARTGLFYLLRQHGLVDVDIKASQCSYRSW
jgi:hypothetical protein